ncbi:DUF6481 family protein [Sphingomonas sp. R647]|uniref:DUF6481 family protein n=1 Tax=Sphingomonas sp. R647 TaxID=2875233 RepID=UPI001CD62077|nr:DUF6481 family protein [Sphingomonas sp. R647]MCA1197145.1 DUF6481 family protein [Sphingomonas sp. R647]
MSSYREPSFQDRTAAAARAKQKALELLRSKPAVDPAVLEERRKAAEARDKALAEERAAKSEAAAAAKAEKAALKQAEAERKAEEQAALDAAAALKEVRLTPPSAAEMKAARDARYAARKARK